MATAKQLDIAQKQTKAAQDSAEAIQGQTRQDQRAWIYVLLQGLPDMEIGKTIVQSLYIANTGKTPAKTFTAVLKLEILGENKSPRFDYSNKQTVVSLAGSAMFPGQHVAVGLTSLTPVPGQSPKQQFSRRNCRISLMGANLAGYRGPDYLSRRFWEAALAEHMRCCLSCERRRSQLVATRG